MGDVKELLSSTKVAAGVSAGSITGGLSLALELGPIVLGILSALAGIALSIIIIRKALKEVEKVELEIELLRERRKFEERQRMTRRELDPAAVFQAPGSE